MTESGSNLSIVIAGCLRTPERLGYLRTTINAFHDHFPKAEYFIGLDNTPEEAYQEAAKEFRFAEVFRHMEGLGHSWNLGIARSSRPFILQSEEDWQCTGHWSKDEPHDLPEKMEYSIDLLWRVPTGLVRLDNMLVMDGRTYPDGSKAPVYEPGWKFFEAEPRTGQAVYELNKPDVRRWHQGWNPYFMTNRPHIKRRNFHEKVGWYMERSNARIHMRSGVDPHRELVPNTEFDICRTVIKHPETRVYFFGNNSVVHIGHVQAR